MNGQFQSFDVKSEREQKFQTSFNLDQGMALDPLVPNRELIISLLRESGQTISNDVSTAIFPPIFLLTG